MVAAITSVRLAAFTGIRIGAVVLYEYCKQKYNSRIFKQLVQTPAPEGFLKDTNGNNIG